MAKHLFKPGQSGNPNGRPKGSGKTAKFRKMLESDAPDVIATVVSAAKNGDMTAAKMILDRIVPVHAERERELLNQMEQLRTQVEQLMRDRGLRAVS